MTVSSSARGEGGLIHHISVVKQEPGIPGIPTKRQRWDETVIDLTESDSEDDSLDSSTAGPSSTGATQQSSSLSTESGSSGSVSLSRNLPAISRAIDAQQQIPHLCFPSKRARTSKVPRGTVNKRLSTSTIPATILPLKIPAVQAAPVARSYSYWQVRAAEIPDKLSTPPPPSTDPSPVNTSIPGDLSSTENDSAVPTNTGVPTTEPTRVHKSPRKRKALSTPEHQHRYKGPELTVISTQAIFKHLDQAWKHASCTVTTIQRLNSWWKSSLVIAAHQLNRQQAWLLAYAEFGWWQALETQWESFEALPDKDRMIVTRMRSVRLNKESKLVGIEPALRAEGSEKNPDAVYMLMKGVKKEQVDEEEKAKEVGEEKEKEGADMGATVQGGPLTEGPGVKVQARKIAGFGDQDGDEELSSDSDEDESE